jgi:outer membrane protein assembly factor BamB
VLLVACGGAPHSRTPSSSPIGLERLARATCSTPLRAANTATEAGPKRPHAHWIRQLPGDWIFSIVPDRDGGVLATKLDGVVALDRDGAERWQHTVAVEPRTAAAIGLDDGAYVGVMNDHYSVEDRFRSEHGGVMRLDNCGAPTWLFHAPAQNSHTPAIASDGTIYFSGHTKVFEDPERVFAVRGDGSVAWSRIAAGSGDAVTTPVLAAADDGVVFGTAHGAVVALDRAGQLRWTTTALAQIVWNASLGPDGTIYAIYDGTLVALDRDGHERWRQPIGSGATPPPVFAADGTMVVGGDRLRAFAPNGTRTWQLDLHGFVIRPVVARDGTIFAASADAHAVGRVYAIDPDATIRWTYYTEQPTALALGGDGRLYVAANHRIYALGECDSDACEDDGTTLAAIGSRPAPVARVQPPAPRPAPRNAEPHDGFTIYPSCRPDVTAVVSTGGAPFAWVVDASASAKSTVARETFRGNALGAAGAIRSHASGFGGGCVDRAMEISVYPGQDVEAAALRLGAWLVQTGQRGEIDLVVEAEPTNL